MIIKLGDINFFISHQGKADELIPDDKEDAYRLGYSDAIQDFSEKQLSVELCFFCQGTGMINYNYSTSVRCPSCNDGFILKAKE